MRSQKGQGARTEDTGDHGAYTHGKCATRRKEIEGDDAVTHGVLRNAHHLLRPPAGEGGVGGVGILTIERASLLSE